MRGFALQMRLLLLVIIGASAETILRAENITATEGSTVTLQCHLLIGDTTVTQVNWNYCNNVHIAFHVSNYETEGIVLREFSDRISLAKHYGITIQGVSRNDSGQYCCVFNTFPHGKFTGKIYLQVSSPDSWTHDWYLWIGSGLGILLVVIAISAGISCYKKKNSQVFYSNIGPATSGANPIRSSTTNLPPVVSSGEDNEEENNEYFNIILYNM
ncbi:T-cell immunoreceptor with Ig and ITIM domains [Dendropsophus ebraccatus]|uniref:T-cell immunoreceptor with Ig and ITIM domains n=1 Tax=Dendropsophus ebraccatus TaxID=150705 RepID=UPI003831F4FE